MSFARVRINWLTNMQNEITKKCSKCHEVKSILLFSRQKKGLHGRASACKICRGKELVNNYWKNPQKHREYARKSYKLRYAKNSQPFKDYANKFRRENPEKVKAQLLVKSAIRNGTLKRLPCEKCGEVKTDAHHEDYTKPLEVRWLCKVHHIQRQVGR